MIQAGPALLLQEIGNPGTIFFALPLALLLSLKREAIGATHSINRETNLALITDMYGCADVLRSRLRYSPGPAAASLPDLLFREADPQCI